MTIPAWLLTPQSLLMITLAVPVMGWLRPLAWRLATTGYRRFRIANIDMKLGEIEARGDGVRIGGMLARYMADSLWAIAVLVLASSIMLFEVTASLKAPWRSLVGMGAGFMFGHSAVLMVRGRLWGAFYADVLARPELIKERLQAIRTRLGKPTP